MLVLDLPFLYLLLCESFNKWWDIVIVTFCLNSKIKGKEENTEEKDGKEEGGALFPSKSFKVCRGYIY